MNEKKEKVMLQGRWKAVILLEFKTPTVPNSNQIRTCQLNHLEQIRKDVRIRTNAFELRARKILASCTDIYTICKIAPVLVLMFFLHVMLAVGVFFIKITF